MYGLRNDVYHKTRAAPTGTTEARPSQSNNVQKIQTDSISSTNGWGATDEDNGIVVDDDKDGWDDLDAFESPTPSPALSRIQAAQQRPVQAANLSQANSVPSRSYAFILIMSFMRVH